MKKLQYSDELEIDERPRVCGGAVFQKFMKKGKCGSMSSWKHDSPVLTSSSSCSSSHGTSASLTNMYDPSNTRFCMPRQIEGESKDGLKLDFKLQTEDNADFYFNNEVDRIDLLVTKEKEDDDFHVEDSRRSHNIIQVNPQMVNDLKTKHMQSISEKKNSEGNSKTEPSTVERRIPGESSAFELTTSLGNEPEAAFKPEQSNRTHRDGFVMEEADDVNENEDVDAAWSQLQLQRMKTNEEQELYDSKASVLRKEISSFRKELNAVKKSLPNQFQTNHFTDKSDERKEALPSKLNSKQLSDKGDVWNVTSTFASNRSKEQTREDVNSNQKYFKNNWDLSFQDKEENNNKTEPSHSAPQKLSSEKVDHKMIQNSENSSSALKTNRSIPEFSEMSFDQVNEIKIPEETKINGHSNSCDEGRESVGLSSQSKQESAKVESIISTDTAHNLDQQQNKEDISASAKSNYEEDMEVVRILMKKYGENIDKKSSDDKAKRILAILDTPSDVTWFHRHAAGVCNKPRKSSTPKADGTSNHSQRKSRMHEHTIPEKPKQSGGTATQVSSKKINRVHFKNPVPAEATQNSALKHLKSTTGNRASLSIQPIKTNALTSSNAQSPRMSQKIKYWEAKKI